MDAEGVLKEFSWIFPTKITIDLDNASVVESSGPEFSIEPDVLKQISKSVSEGSFGSYIQFGSLMLNGMRYDLLAGSYSAPWVLKSDGYISHAVVIAKLGERNAMLLHFAAQTIDNLVKEFGKITAKD